MTFRLDKYPHSFRVLGVTDEGRVSLATEALCCLCENNIYLLKQIFVTPSLRGNNYASIMLEMVLREVDKAKIPVICYPCPYREPTMSKEELIAFYKRHGFVDYKDEDLIYCNK